MTIESYLVRVFDLIWLCALDTRIQINGVEWLSFIPFCRVDFYAFIVPGYILLYAITFCYHGWDGERHHL